MKSILFKNDVVLFDKCKRIGNVEDRIDDVYMIIAWDCGKSILKRRSDLCYANRKEQIEFKKYIRK